MTHDDLKPRTKREVLMCREAYRLGARDERFPEQEGFMGVSQAERSWMRYPIPKKVITQPRVAWSAGAQYRVRVNLLERYENGRWVLSRHSLDGIRALADLLANPTETIEVEVDE